MSANTEPLHEPSDRDGYYYRRRLTPRELLPALAVGIAGGLVAFYVARLLTERTRFVQEASTGSAIQRRSRSSGAAG
jgi:hypothetical protein